MTRSLPIVDEWRKKSIELSNPSKIDILCPMKKALDAMSLVLSSNPDRKEIQSALLSLDTDRKFAMQFEKPKDAVRLVGYGLLECIHLTLLSLTGKIENLEGIIRLKTREDNANPTEATIAAPSLAAPKIEHVAADPSPVENEIADPADAPNPSFSTIIKEDSELLNFMDTSLFKEEAIEDHHLPSNSMPENGIHNATAYDSMDDERGEEVDVSQLFPRSEIVRLPRGTPKTPVVNFKRKSSEIGSKTPKRQRSQEDSDNDYEYKPNSAKKNVPKRSKSVIECHKCEYRTHFVREWASHLNHKHSTSALEEGVALRCECGHESYIAKHHSIVCPRANFTAIRKPKDTSTPTTPKCIMCDMYPKSAYGYAYHLHYRHRTKLKEKKLQLKCECGDLRDNITAIRKHASMCKGPHFTLHKTGRKRIV